MGSDCIIPKKMKEFHHQSQFQIEQVPLVLEPLVKQIKNGSIFAKFYGKYLQGYDHEDRDKIIKLIKGWSSLDRMINNIAWLTKTEYTDFYINVDILAARVYARFIQLIQSIKDGHLKLDFKKSAENDKICDFFKFRQWRFSYDRYFFQNCNNSDLEKTSQNGSANYDDKRKNEIKKYNLMKNNEDQTPKSENISINKLLMQCRIDLLRKVYIFMIDIYLINLTKRQVKNTFIKKLERIQKRQQKEAYVKDMQFAAFQEIKDAEQKNKPIKQMAFLENSFHNYYYYKISITSLLRRFKRQDNTVLEDETLKYIQWMFPNHYKSEQNMQSFPLGYLQKRLFLFDEQVGLYVLLSICAFFKLIGLKVRLPSLKLSICDENKLITLFKYYKVNSGVMMRILACLSVIGFRSIAIDLILLLNQFAKSSKSNIFTNRQIQNWNSYSNTKIESAKKLCFLQEENFPQEHSILQKLRELQEKSQKTSQLVQSRVENKQYAAFDLQVKKVPDQANQSSLKISANSNKEEVSLSNPYQNKNINSNQADKWSKPQLSYQKINLRNIPKLNKIFGEIASKIQKRAGIVEKIEKAIMPKYDANQRKMLYQLLYQWGNEKILDFDISDLIKPCHHKYYKNVDILSARVYARAMAYVQKTKYYNGPPSKENDSIRFLFLNKQFSYDRFFFESKSSENQYYKQFNANSYQNWPSKIESNQRKKNNEASDTIRKVFETISQSKQSQLKALFNFMKEIDLIVLNEHEQSTNTFIRRIQTILKTDQKSLYFQSIQFTSLQTIISINKDGANLQKIDLAILCQLQEPCPNYYFYSVEISDGKRSLHKSFQDYRTLEVRHDYVQWMFPNHYPSAFNSQAVPLNYLEQRLFLDPEIGFRMMVSIYIFFDFLGIRLNLKDFGLFMISSGRFKQAIIVNTHNHMRLMRILACLSITGFRIIALNLIKFLDENTKPGQAGASVRNEFERSWKIYGNEYNGRPLQKAKQMCFLEQENFPEEHCILKIFRENSIYQKQQTLPQKSLNQQKASSSSHKKNKQDKKYKNTDENEGEGCSII